MYFHCIIQKYYCASQNRRCFFWRNGCYCNEYKLTVMQFHVCVEKPTEHYLHAALYGFKLHTKTHQHITRLFLYLATKFFSERTHKYIPLYASLQLFKILCQDITRYTQLWWDLKEDTQKHFSRIIWYYTIKRRPWKTILGKWHSFYMNTNHHRASRQANINHANGQKIQIDTYNLHQLLQCFPHNPGTLFK